MCGIIGFIGPDAARKSLVGLATLEYRGYDSAGIGYVTDGKIAIIKTVGDVAALKAKIGKTDISRTSTAIAHTRWATHGGVSDINAHPHADCTRKIAVIHNGIIENYAAIREALKAKGHKFVSQTDSEVVSHLIEEEMKAAPFEKAALIAAGKLRGSYAILAISSTAPGIIVAAKNESPLVFAFSKDFAAAASDPVPLLPFAKSGVFLEDGDFAVACIGSVEIFRIDSGKPVPRREISFGNTESIVTDKKNFAHFMQKEIHEAPQAIKLASMQDMENVKAIATEISKKRVVFVAAGTSRHASLVGRYLFNSLAGKFCDVVVASEFQYIAQNMVGKDLLVIAVSQSGETADVMDGVKIAKAKGAKILSITNVVGSSLDRISDFTIHLNCGPEVGVAATKTFTAQLAIMYLIAAALTGKENEEKTALEAVSASCEKSLAGWDERARKIAGRLYREPAAYFIARGPNFPTALEGALKFKEITYIHAEGMAAGELKHGTLALISNGTPVIAVCPDDRTHNATLSNVMETKARGAFVVGLSDVNDPSFDEWISVPKVDEYHYPLVFALPLQFHAYHTSVLKGNNPDRPRNLAKSVTVK